MKQINSQYQQQGCLNRFSLSVPHPEDDTHFLVEIVNPLNNLPHKEIIPRVLGCSIPKLESDSESYYLFMLAHFRPFSHLKTLGDKGVCLNKLFSDTTFLDQSLSVMKNWNAIHECEDERDAERLKKKDNVLKKS